MSEINCRSVTNPKEYETVVELRKKGFGWRQVAKILGKPLREVYSKYRYVMPEGI